MIARMHKAALKPFADLVSRMHQRIEAMDDADLVTLRDAVNSVSQTNCWWAAFQAAQFIRPVIEAEQYRRRAAIKEADE